MNDKEIAVYDKGMRDVLSSVVIVGSTTQAQDRSALEDFPKICVRDA
jgi:hypothetical protein